MGALSAHAGGRGFPLISLYSNAEIGTDAASFCIRQGPDGSMLVGGNSLLEFDGERWRNTPIPGAYGLHDLAFGPDGKLWVAALGEIGWFERTNGHPWKFHSLRPHLPPGLEQLGETWHVFAEGAGAVFVSKTRILRWDGAKFATWEVPTGRRLPAMRVNGTIYFHSGTLGLCALGGAGPEPVVSPEALEGAVVIWMEPRERDWLLATNRGLLLHSQGKVVPFAPETSEQLRQAALTCATRLADGRYAFGTFTSGIVLMQPDGSPDRTLTKADGLPSDYITSLTVDRDGALWATGLSHIARIDLQSASSLYDARANLPAIAYRQLTQHGERIVAATESGLYELAPGTGQFVRSESIRESIQDLRSTRRGLVAGLFKSARVIDGATSTAIHTTTSDVLAIAESRLHPQRLFLADDRSIVANDGAGVSRVLVTDLPDYARSMAEDDQGRLWIATMARGVLLARLDAASAVQATAIPASFGLPALEGRAVVRENLRGAILVFADNGGWVKPAGVERFHPIRDYPARAVTAATDFSGDGTGWVVHPETETRPACVGRVSSDETGVRWQPHAIPGLARIGAPRSILAEAGRPAVLWIGGTQSILRHEITPGAAALPPRAPTLKVHAITANNEVLRPITGALPYSTRAVEFEFAAPDYSRRAELRLETRIDGVDQGWVPARRDSRRQLTALRDARYAFHVRAVTDTGLVSDAAVFHFEVLPPPWRSGPVLVLAGVALLPLGYGLYRLRVRALQRHSAQLERKVRERTEELEQANAAKTQFVANMSHDIRNPLNGIVGLALALEDTRLDTRQREIVATLRECTTYLSSLVDDVLDFASIEAGRVELRPGPFVPQELLRSIVETLKADIAESGARVTIESAPDIPAHIVGDAGRIQQILVNFVSNALKYAGGHIRLIVSVPAGAADEIEFSVRDEGAGLSAEEQAKLFTKFSRLKQAHGSEQIPGTGLGLAACRLLADIMGGSVGVESRCGEGSRFFLRLPLTIAVTPVEPSTVNLPNTTVLLVEDTDYNAWAATAVLAKLGLSCERARTGAEALELFAAKRFNVVLLDRNLPDMDGIEVARRMRAMESDGLQAILLAVTAYCTAEDRALSLEAGMDAFVGKPVTPEKLRKVLLAAGQRLLSAASLHVTQEPAPAELNLSLLSYLADGSPEGLEIQVERFVATLDTAQAEIVASLQARDFASLATVAHRLLGQAKMVGSVRLADAATELEAAGRAQNVAACLASADDVRAEAQAVTAAMRRRSAVPST